MIPSKTYEWFAKHGRGRVRRFDESGCWTITNTDLTDLAALADRLNGSITDGNELRDWQNRINTMIDGALTLD